MPNAPAASCALGSGRTHTSNNEYTGITRRPRTQWFYDLFRALPGDRAFLSPSLAEYVTRPHPVGPTCHPANLTPASRRQDHRTSPYAATSLVRSLLIAHGFVEPALQSRRAQNAAASTAFHPAFRDDHDTPLLWGGMAQICRDDLSDGESKIFFLKGLDRVWVICSSGCFVAARSRDCACARSEAELAGA
jgi:hypothetical protein